MYYREELFKALTAGVDGVFRDKSIDALVEVCRAANWRVMMQKTCTAQVGVFPR